MKVTFCGHRDVEDYKKVKVWLYNKIEKLISEGATEFLLGGYGKFDNIAAKTLEYAKRRKKSIINYYSEDTD